MSWETSLLLPVVAGVGAPPGRPAHRRGVHPRGGGAGTLRLQVNGKTGQRQQHCLLMMTQLKSAAKSQEEGATMIPQHFLARISADQMMRHMSILLIYITTHSVELWRCSTVAKTSFQKEEAAG